MSYIYYNPNPDRKSVGDCVVRALSKAFKDSWENIYVDLSMLGYDMHDMPNSNAVWGEYLKLNGYRRYAIPNTCPNCYTIRDFCVDNPHGSFVIATGSHVVYVESGNYYDSSDSGNEVPIYYWRKEK